MQTEQMRLFKSIFQVSNLMHAAGDRLSAELTFKQWFLLLVLCRNPQGLSVNEVAQKLAVKRQSVKKMIAILENKGYVATTKAENDGRALCVAATDKALAFWRGHKELGFGLMQQALAGIEEDKLDVAQQVLQAVVANLARAVVKNSE